MISLTKINKKPNSKLIPKYQKENLIKTQLESKKARSR